MKGRKLRTDKRRNPLDYLEDTSNLIDFEEFSHKNMQMANEPIK